MKLISSSNPELPVVRVTDGAIKSFGSDLSVDLDAVNELLRYDLGLVREVVPQYVLYGRTRNSPIAGFHLPFTKTAFVQLPASTQPRESGGYSMIKGVTRAFIHESVHLVDSVEHRNKSLGELSVKGAWATGGTMAAIELASMAPNIAKLPVGITAYLGVNAAYYHLLDPAEKRAREKERDNQLVAKYRGMIRFLDFPTL